MPDDGSALITKYRRTKWACNEESVECFQVLFSFHALYAKAPTMPINSPPNATAAHASSLLLPLNVS